MQRYFGITRPKDLPDVRAFLRYEKSWWIFILNVEMQCSQINQQNRNSYCFTQATDTIIVTQISAASICKNSTASHYRLSRRVMFSIIQSDNVLSASTKLRLSLHKHFEDWVAGDSFFLVSKVRIEGGEVKGFWSCATVFSRLRRDSFMFVFTCVLFLHSSGAVHEEKTIC